jgi:hypothetical protein
VRIRPFIALSIAGRNGPGLRPGVTLIHERIREDCACWGCAMVRVLVCVRGRSRPLRPLALTLLVAQVLADDHDPTVATNDLALVADRLDARLDLHGLTPVCA